MKTLFEAARDAMRSAYAPYSGFPVGAAALAPDGAIFTGANVENAAYPLGVCAETAAIAALVNAGQRRIAAIAVCAGGAELVSPCGGCRQRIREFADADTPIHLCTPDGVRRTVTLGELLPLSFGPEHLP